MYDHIGEKSGGESQELVAFIVGAALRYQLGDAGAARPRYAPVFLDEALIKADAHFTGRAIGAWRGLGFQLVIGAPNDKHSAIEPHVDAEYLILKNAEGRSWAKPAGRCPGRMSALVTPQEAVAAVRRKIEQQWPEPCAPNSAPATRSCSPFRSAPVCKTGKAVEQLGYAAWHEWHMRWREFYDRLPAGVELVRRAVTIRGVAGEFPATLKADLDGAVALIADTRSRCRTTDRGHRPRPCARVGAAISQREPHPGHAPGRLAASGHRRGGAAQCGDLATPAPRREHMDPAATPGPRYAHQVARHPRRAAARRRRTRCPGRGPAPADRHAPDLCRPDHTASGRRRHDAWTTGDVHDIAYRPRVVLVVENRDSRLWFPPVSDTIVVEGGGKAAAALLANVPWIRAADHVVYWGDIDSGRVRDPRSIPRHARRAGTGRCTGETGHLHPHGSHRPAPLLAARRQPRQGGAPHQAVTGVLPHLTEAETTAYNTIATAGPTPFRRIEQEAIPLTHAVTRLQQILNGRN